MSLLTARLSAGKAGRQGSSRVASSGPRSLPFATSCVSEVLMHLDAPPACEKYLLFVLASAIGSVFGCAFSDRAAANALYM